MDPVLVAWVVTDEGLNSEFSERLKNILPQGLNRDFLRWAEGFKKTEKRLPLWEEAQSNFKDLPAKNGLSKEDARLSLIRGVREEEARNSVIRIANRIDSGEIDATLFNEVKELAEKWQKSEVDSSESTPLALPDFFKQIVSPVEYFCEGVLQKQGRLMLSASSGVGKSFFMLNLALALTTGKVLFLDKFSIHQARTLYLDFEMGSAVLKSRLSTMCAQGNLGTDALFIKHLPPIDLLNAEWQSWLEDQLFSLKIEVLILDPLSNIWTGDENAKQEVSRLTGYLDNLVNKFKVSVCVVHHWRKATKEFKTGGVMASGSHKWSAWLEHHICLAGNDINSIIVSCEKSRNSVKFNPFIVKLNPETFWLEFLANFEKKFTEETLTTLFNQVDSGKTGKVSIPDIIKIADGKPSRATIQRLIAGSQLFQKEISGKKSFLIKKDTCSSVQRGNEQVYEIKNVIDSSPA